MFLPGAGAGFSPSVGLLIGSRMSAGQRKLAPLEELSHVVSSLVEVAGRVVSQRPPASSPRLNGMLQERVKLQELVVSVVYSTW